MYCLFPSQSCTGVHGSDHGGRGLGARGKATKRTPATSRTVSGTLSHCTSTQYIHASIVARQTGMFMYSTCTYTLHTYMYMNKSRTTGRKRPLGLDVKQSPHVYMTVHCSCELGHRDKAKQLHLGDGYFCTWKNELPQAAASSVCLCMHVHVIVCTKYRCLVLPTCKCTCNLLWIKAACA